MREVNNIISELSPDQALGLNQIIATFPNRSANGVRS